MMDRENLNFCGDIPIVGVDSNCLSISVSDDSVSPDRSNEIDIQPFLDEIKTEITKHVEEERKRLKHITLSYMQYITEHADKEIERINDHAIDNLTDALKEIAKARNVVIDRIKYSLITSIDQFLKEPKE